MARNSPTPRLGGAGSTLGDVRTVHQNRAGRIGRAVALGVLAVVVAAGASGWLGVRALTARTSSGAYHLALTYPRVARSGLDVPWELRLTHPGGFAHDIVIAVSANYFDILEYQDFHPEPSGETAGAKYDYLTFAPPPGDVFTLSLDTYVQPASQIGRDASVVAIVGGTTVGRIDYKTWLAP